MNRSADVQGPLTSTEFEILLSLADGDQHGYAILQDIDARTDGALNLRPGTLYRAMNRLLGAGFIAEIPLSVKDDPRRRTYRLTPEGRRIAASEAARLARQVSTARLRRVLRSS
jgi:DNA-binding PadR family transcriptional regulator